MYRAFFLCALLTLTIACPRKDSETSLQLTTGARAANTLQLNTSKGMVTFEVEIAKNPVDRAQGLMRRESLAPDRGMLFIFDEDADHSFWMKNTYLPLDLVFFDKNWIVVGMLENLEPLSTKSRSIQMASRYVLEINAGLIKKLGIVMGNPAVLVEKEKG